MQPDQMYFADVEWVKPGGGKTSGNRLLSLYRYDGTDDVPRPWVAFSSQGENSIGMDRYLFECKDKAIAFKRDVEKRYAEDPEYCVINDDGESVLDGNGEKQVAWEPYITITTASPEEIQSLQVEYDRTRRRS